MNLDASTCLPGETAATARVREGDALRKAGRHEEACAAYLAAAERAEIPDGDLCLRIARAMLACERPVDAARWAARVADAPEQFLAWQAGAAVLNQAFMAIEKTSAPSNVPLTIKRTASVWIASSYTTKQWAPMLRLAAWRWGIKLEVLEGDYGQYQQDVLDPDSRLYAAKPDFVLFAVHEGEAQLNAPSADPQSDVEAEASRWKSLWSMVAERASARVIQHLFPVPGYEAFGHLAMRVQGSRTAMVRKLNGRLGELAGDGVGLVDVDRLAGEMGSARWGGMHGRYWFLAKQAVALDALPALAKHTAAVIAAQLGLGRKCLVLDLDNTLWGGVIGEDGLTGIRLGQGSPEGEAYLALQEVILGLKAKGIVLAVCSKNNEADAREPFLRHPEMRIKLDDIAIFTANWQDKPGNLRTIAQSLNIGLDALVFLDDNPVERAVVRRFVPEVETPALPSDPLLLPAALASCLWFETSTFTREDAEKTGQYRAKAEIASLEAGAGSLEEFHRSLHMRAVVESITDATLPRVVQLIGKTNQFNLTTRRHGAAQVREFMNDASAVTLTLTLRDRFADHGLVSVLIARIDPADATVMEIDTWLMSCRVIGRTVEAELLSHLCRAAQRRGCTKVRGVYIPTAKNPMVRDIFERFGFEAEPSVASNESRWVYDLATRGAIVNGYITLEEPVHDAA